MEDTLRAADNAADFADYLVLILVLMEDTLRAGIALFRASHES